MMPLADVLGRVPENLFAVVDGAFYDDLPSDLSSAGYASRPLYLGESAIAGPHLVALSGEASVDGLLGLLGNPVAAVFWSWPDDEESFYRHLRSIGMMELPKSGTNPNDSEYDAVTFRHADPRSIAAILPVLQPQQRLTLFGEAAGIVCQYKDRLGAEFIVRASRGGQIFVDRV